MQPGKHFRIGTWSGVDWTRGERANQERGKEGLTRQIDVLTNCRDGDKTANRLRQIFFCCTQLESHEKVTGNPCDRKYHGKISGKSRQESWKSHGKLTATVTGKLREDFRCHSIGSRSHHPSCRIHASVARLETPVLGPNVLTHSRHSIHYCSDFLATVSSMMHACVMENGITVYIAGDI